MGVVLLLTFPVTYFGLIFIMNIKPPIIDSSKEKIIVGETVSKTASIAIDADKLKETLENIDNLTIDEIKSTIQNSIKVSDKIKVILEKQQQNISKLSISVKKERAKAEEAKKLAENIMAITKPQLEAVKLLILGDANEKANKSFYLGIVLSFPVGVIASLVAMWAARRSSDIFYRKKTQQSHSL